MESKGGKPGFLYDIPNTSSTPAVSSRGNTKIFRGDPKQTRRQQKLDSWPHDHQPPSSFYSSTESGQSKKLKSSASQDSVPDSQADDTEIVPSSLPQSGDEAAHMHRFSSRLMEKDLQCSKSKWGAGSSKEDADTAIRTLESSIHENDLEIEKTKEHRSKLLKEITRLQDLASTDESVIRTYERANMSLKSRKEEIKKRKFASRPRSWR